MAPRLVTAIVAAPSALVRAVLAVVGVGIVAPKPAEPPYSGVCFATVVVRPVQRSGVAIVYSTRPSGVVRSVFVGVLFVRTSSIALGLCASYAGAVLR